jgi:hypothetical protein
MLLNGLDAASAVSRSDTKVRANSIANTSRVVGQPLMRDIRTLRAPGALPLDSISNRQSHHVSESITQFSREYRWFRPTSSAGYQCALNRQQGHLHSA